MSAFTAIPVIDLASFDESLTARKAIAQNLKAACIDVGFFYLKNSGMPQGLLEETFHQSKEYFQLPLSEKQKLSAHENNYRGYSGLLAENVNPDNQGDMHESFDLGPEGQAADGTVQHNVWPNATLLPRFQETCEEYYKQVLLVFKKLLPLFALALDLDEHFFADKSTRDASILRLLYYPAAKPGAEANEKVLGIGSHTDYEIVTLLAQQSQGATALQVLNKAGSWIDVPPRTDCDYICNIGDQLAMWTNDLFVSTTHRALNVDVDRLSIPCFCGVDYDTVIETLLTCITPDRPAKYPAVEAGQWVAQRLQESYAQSKSEHDQKKA